MNKDKIKLLCENVIKNAENCLIEIGGNKNEMQCSNCQYKLAKEILEDLNKWA